jgi:membrane protein YdbS with pleckstrin-like domain
MRCHACGAEVVEQAIFCHKCGERLGFQGEQSTPPEREKAEPNAESAARGADDAPSAQAAGPTERARAVVTSRVSTEDEPEKELWQGGYSARAMIGGWLTTSLVTIALLVAGIWWNVKWLWTAVVFAILLSWLYLLLLLAYRRSSVRYILTNQRFVHEKGFLRRVTDRIEVIDIDDITFTQGVLERLLGVGTIIVASSDRTHPQLIMPGIENVKEVADVMDNARRSERRRRGLHIEQV